MSTVRGTDMDVVPPRRADQFTPADVLAVIVNRIRQRVELDRSEKDLAAIAAKPADSGTASRFS
ncbi:hypothetical protein AJ87_08715 [Rhizobium yanglingense]|nr:hypothetical protein AJ87_08715 [Rhizobium yanglingense]